MVLTPRQRTALIVVAAFSFVVTNGVFLYWLIFRPRDLVAGLLHPAALVFEIDVLVVLGLLAAYFRKHPLGPWSWKAFLVLSVVGGLGFSIPTFVLLNSPSPKASPGRPRDM